MKLIKTLIILIFLLPNVALGLTFKSDGSVVDGKGNILETSKSTEVNISQFEKDYQKGYNYCMFIIFDSLKNRKAYDKNKFHYRLSKKLIPALENGMKSILSFDITI